MKILSIRIQGMHNVIDKTYIFKDMNYFVGSNGAGKSTVLQAIQLALLGYIPGTDKKKSAVFQHSNGHEMSVHLIIDNNGTDISINRTWTRTGKEIKAIVSTVPEDINISDIIGKISLPIFNFNEWLSMTSNKLKDWFINFLPNADSNIDWETILRDSVKDYGIILNPQFIEDTVKYVNGIETTGINQVREFNTYLKQLQSFKKSELTRVQSTVQSLIYYDDCDNTEDPEALKRQLYDDNASILKIKNDIQAIQKNETTKLKLNSLKLVTASSLDEDKTYIKNCNAISELESNIHDLDKAVDDALKKREQLAYSLSEKTATIHSKGICPYSKSICNTIKNSLPIISKEVEDIKHNIEVLNTDRTAKHTEKVALHNTLQKYLSENAQITAEYTQYDAMISTIDDSIKNTSVSELTLQIESIEAHMNHVNDLIVKLEANKKYTALVDVLTSQKYEIEQELEILKIWVKLTDVNGLQSDMMKAPFNNLARKMTAYLNKFFNDTNLTASFHLTQEANSFSFGLYKDNNYIEYDMLSSGEKCLYTLALLFSLVEISDTHLPIILIDDLLDHLDASNINNCFETLYSINDIQIVLAGVQKCTHSEASNFVHIIN